MTAGLGVTERVRANDEGGPPAASQLAPAPLDVDPADEEEATAARRKPLGLMFDLGSMSGGMLSLLYRPAPWLRLHAGAGTNAVSPGYRAGVTLAKTGGGPSLNLEGGHFLPGDINGLLKILVGTGYRANPALEHFDYDFVNVHAGWDIESGSLIFFARGGVGVLWTTVPTFARADATSPATTTGTEPFWLVIPSVSLGFVGLL
jgi:hypothetical protein